MGKSNFMLLIIIVVIAGYIIYTNPDVLSGTDSRASNIKTSSLGRGTYFQNDTVVDDIAVDSVNSTDTLTQSQDYLEVIPGVTNQCGYRHFAYPNYIGTEKQGDTCKDVPKSERDMECFANAPISYDGELILERLYSNPKITCCDIDGTCQW